MCLSSYTLSRSHWSYSFVREFSVSRGIVFTERICWSEDLKTAVVGGLLHYHLKNLLPKAELNCWLTVHTAISDPELVFGSHSSPPVMRWVGSEKWEPSMDSIPVDQGAVEDASGIAKKFPENMSQHALRPIFAPRNSQRTTLDSTKNLNEVGKTLLDWQHAIGHCVLIQHLEKFVESFIQLISFCHFLYLTPANSRQYLILDKSSSCQSVPNICSWRSGWSCRRTFVSSMSTNSPLTPIFWYFV